jgi:hypothetical protein
MPESLLDLLSIYNETMKTKGDVQHHITEELMEAGLDSTRAEAFVDSFEIVFCKVFENTV